jgi:hypothetical protein
VDIEAALEALHLLGLEAEEGAGEEVAAAEAPAEGAPAEGAECRLFVAPHRTA